MSRALSLLQNEPAKSLNVVDAALKNTPKDQRLRFIKALALLDLEKTADAVAILRELSNESFAPAALKLARQLGESEDKDEIKQAIALYERYVELEPHDPRGFQSLASAYFQVEDPVKAEAAHRKAIASDPLEAESYLNFIEFLMVNDRIADAQAVLIDAERHADTDDEDLWRRRRKPLLR